MSVTALPNPPSALLQYSNRGAAAQAAQAGVSVSHCHRGLHHGRAGAANLLSLLPQPAANISSNCLLTGILGSSTNGVA